MTDQAGFEQLRSDLFQPERGLYVVPIRHHSPACAWYLKQLIKEVRPKRVLIEAPADFASQIPLLLDDATKPPVALVSLVDPPDGRPRVAGYYPFCDHSPEFVALREGHAVGAELRFIDAPVYDKAMFADPGTTEPVSFMDEQHFDSNDYINALARETGCRDGYELWDHLFEARFGADGWKGFFQDVGVYCAGIRAATHEEKTAATGDAQREAHMAAAIRKGLKAGGPVVVVVGGFHAPALVGDLTNFPKPEKSAGSAESYLIRYGFRALDALNGYGAGLPQPGYYQRLWENGSEATQNWRELAIDLLSGFAETMRADGQEIALPALTEAIRTAETLALLRGRPGALRHDLIDGVRAALIKGEASQSDIWTGRFQSYLCGDRLGDVPVQAGSPPLVEDARARARLHRFDISDSLERRRKLDIRRKETQLEASRFCHAMMLVGSGFASRETGPDYVTGARTELLFEEWTYAWSPQVEGRMIESSVLGDDLPTACLAQLHRSREGMIEEGKARDLAGLVELFSRGLMAGLGTRLAPFLDAVAGDIQNYGTFATVTHALQRLMYIRQSTGPLRAPDAFDLGGITDAAYARLVYLCDELPETGPEQIKERLAALRVTIEILQSCRQAGLDRVLLEEAMDRAAKTAKEPVILGAVLAVCVQTGLRQADMLVLAVKGQLSGVSLNVEDRIGVLRGILHASPMLLWHSKELLAAVDDFLCAIPEEDFLRLLPHLRLALTALNPRDTDTLAQELAIIHKVQTGSLLTSDAMPSDTELAQALQIEKAIRASLKSDHLTGWISGEAS